MTENLQTILVTVFSTVIANGAIMFPLLKFTVVAAWNKSIQWRDMVNDINSMKEQIKKLQTDVTAAHAKIREMSRNG